MTDIQLADCIRDGKRTVLQSIRKNLPPALAASAEDIAQETFLRYYRRYEFQSPLGGENLRRYLYVTARNECRRAALKANRDWIALLKHDWNFQTEENKMEEITAKEEDALRIHLEKLPNPFKQVAEMRMNGMKLKEIAGRLDLSIGTVKSRLARAKEALARHLQAEGLGRDA